MNVRLMISALMAAGLVLLSSWATPGGAQPARLTGKPALAAIVGNTLYDARGDEYSFVDRSGEMRSWKPGTNDRSSVKWVAKDGEFCVVDGETYCFKIELAGDKVDMVSPVGTNALNLLSGNPKNL